MRKTPGAGVGTIAYPVANCASLAIADDRLLAARKQGLGSVAPNAARIPVAEEKGGVLAKGLVDRLVDDAPMREIGDVQVSCRAPVLRLLRCEHGIQFEQRPRSAGRRPVPSLA